MKQQPEYICTEYDRAAGKTGRLLLILTVEGEMHGKYDSGTAIFINGKEFVLGERGIVKKTGVVMYELNRRMVTALPLD